MGIPFGIEVIRPAIMTHRSLVRQRPPGGVAAAQHLVLGREMARSYGHTGEPRNPA